MPGRARLDSRRRVESWDSARSLPRGWRNFDLRFGDSCSADCRPGESISLIPQNESVDPVLRLLAGSMMGLQPAADLPPELGLAIPAQAFAVLARPLDFCEMSVVRLEDVVVLREDGADVRIRTEAPLLLDRGTSAREGVHDLFLGLGLRVRREDARFRNRGGHLARRSQQAREEFVVDQGGFRIPELGRDVPRDPEMGVLVDPARDEDGDLVARLHGRQEGGRRLDARVEDLADVVGILEPEDRLGRRERDPLRDLHCDRIEVPDVFGVEEDLREFRVESHRDDVEDVVIADLRRLLEVVEILEEELLVVRDLEVQRGAELLLEPFCEKPRKHVTDVDSAGTSPPRVPGEAVAFAVFPQYPIELPMAVEYSAAAHGLEFARYFPDLLEEVRGEPLGAKLGNEPVVVNLAFDVPRRDDEIFGQFPSEEEAPR